VDCCGATLVGGSGEFKMRCGRITPSSVMARSASDEASSFAAPDGKLDCFASQ
jgi:hypothetical protein